MNALKQSLWLAPLACLALLLAGQASAQLRALEAAIETSTDAVLLPNSVPGRLTFRDCKPPCRTHSLDVNSETSFFIGATKVSLSEFNQYISKTGSQFLMVFYEPSGRSITRLIVFGELGQ
jgi:hypothetical protein